MSAARPLSQTGRAVTLPPAALLVGAVIGAALPAAGVGGTGLGLVLVVVVPLAALVLGGRARVIATLGCAACAVALVWAHTRHFVPLYAYAGLIYSKPPLDATLVVVALAALPATWLPLGTDRPSTVVLWFLYLGAYLPAVVMPVLLTGDLEAVLPFHLALVASMALLSLIVRLVPGHITTPHLSPTGFTRLLVGLAVLAMLYMVAAFGLHSPPALEDVYSTRAEFKGSVGQVPGAAYVIAWAGNVVNPMLMALGMRRRRVDVTALALAGQLLIYSNSGFKNVLFSIVLVPLVYVAISRARRSFGLLAGFAATAVLVGGVAANSLTSGWSLSLVRRQFAVPGQVQSYYFDYFSAHAPYQLSHSFLGWLFPRAYSVDPGLLIGRVFFPGTNTNANAAYWADAFANFGFAGIVGFTMGLGVLLWLADGLGRGRDLRVLGPVLAIMGLALAEGALFTTILTFGLGLALVLMAIMPPEDGIWRETRAGRT